MEGSHQQLRVQIRSWESVMAGEGEDERFQDRISLALTAQRPLPVPYASLAVSLVIFCLTCRDMAEIVCKR